MRDTTTLETHPGTSTQPPRTTADPTSGACAQRIPYRRTALSALFIHLIGMCIACASMHKGDSTSTRIDDVTIRIGIGEAYLWGATDRRPNGHTERYERLRELFESAGCAELEPTRTATSAVDTNLLICRLEGQTERSIIVVSDFEKSAWMKSDGWPAAAFLPALYSALAVEERKHSFVFMASDEIRGMRGRARTRAGLGIPNSVRPDDLAAIVNIRAMGRRVFGVVSDRADQGLYHDLKRVGRSLQIPVELARASRHDKYPTEDATVLIRSDGSQIPAISLAISDSGTSSYLDSFRTLAAYLAYIDQTDR